MGFIRPATPGFIVTLVAAILLAVVSFSVPLIKSVYFLQASLAVQGIDGTITFGTLGYCVSISGSTTCSNATVGYELNVNALVGDNTAIQIPTVVVKWLTYVLVLHIVAFALAGTAALLGLLAHVREMAMTYFSSCISAFGGAVAFIAFIFDIAIFFVAKSRMNSVSGGSAAIGNAVWLTLSAALLLFFSGCFYGIGRCCIRRRGKDAWGGQPRDRENGFQNPEHVRLDVVKAEADRKASQAQGEVGLPAFEEFQHSKDVDDRRHSRGQYVGGYAPVPRGERAVDQLAPHPQRSGSTTTHFTPPSQASSPSPPEPSGPPDPFAGGSPYVQDHNDLYRPLQVGQSMGVPGPTGQSHYAARARSPPQTNHFGYPAQSPARGLETGPQYVDNGPTAWSPPQTQTDQYFGYPGRSPARGLETGTQHVGPSGGQAPGTYAIVGGEGEKRNLVLSPSGVPTDEPPRYDMYGLPR